MAKRILDFNEKKQYSTLALRWCKNFFGQNELKRTKLTIEVTKRNRSTKSHVVFGNYCFYRNKITIHESPCKTIYDIVSTVIHEYTHYLQSRNLYRTYQDQYYYSTNPCEREAKRNEQKYTKLCIKDIKKLL
jgi:uncharacterized protein YjaZ